MTKNLALWLGEDQREKALGTGSVLGECAISR